MVLNNLCLIDTSTPEIFGLSETWLNENTDDDMINIPNYLSVHHVRNRNSGKSGGSVVMLYCKNDINVVYLPELAICEPSIECVWI